jgi:Protein of unknown function DUF262/Protein of unknown function (DUF1524)/Restriction Enzyme Adenine Methylase Associated
VETQVRTPQMVFMQPQRLVVPLFQRPYVWNEENQWEPLWSDVSRAAKRLLADPTGRHYPHFLGAVVIQQLQNPLGTMQERTIIDGQQRLTTMQLLLDALGAELEGVGATQPATRIEALVSNQEAFWERPEDRFKVWPTNRDRAAFNEVMSAPSPVDYDSLAHRGSRMVQAHQYFASRAREWLQASADGDVQVRAAAVERSVRELMQMVVIDLSADENAQEIFETLNARGAQLTAADLIKNFVFQRLIEVGANVEAAYEQYWKDFETGFWEAEVSAGRVKQARSSIFLNHWLIARTGDEILAREVFYRFKAYSDFDSGADMPELLRQIDQSARVYREFVSASTTLTGPLDRVGLFAYRTGVMESEVVKPLVLLLLDPEEEAVSAEQLTKALDVLESWLVRRMLVRATSKAYNQVMAELISQIRKAGRIRAGDVLEDYLRAQTGGRSYWPDDDELTRELSTLPVYRRLSRGRLRMVLEAIEDHLRGWRGSALGLGGERVARGKYAIEHVMPRRWQMHWPLPADRTAIERDSMIHTLGNLTLLTGRLNSQVSNGPWAGNGGKQAALHRHDVLMVNRQLLGGPDDNWSDDAITARTERLIRIIREVWPVPAGHSVGPAQERKRPKRRVEIADLLAAGLIQEGATLYARRRGLADRTATVLSDGSLDVEGLSYTSPSGAAGAVTGGSENGWWFWLLDPKSRKSLNDLWHQYVDQQDVDVDDADAPDEDDD